MPNITNKYNSCIKIFEKINPKPTSELEYTNPFELLVAVILSAQCTDKRVNMMTPALFKRFPTPKILSEGDVDEIFEYIKSCSYPNNKAKYLQQMAILLVENYNSTVPSDIDELQKLPGVGRKTANVIAAVIYDKPTFAVDTHVFRVSARIGLTKNAKTPLAAEKQLTKNCTKDKIPNMHHWLILHGRYICTARKPKCNKCPITQFCDSFEKL